MGTEYERERKEPLLGSKKSSLCGVESHQNVSVINNANDTEFDCFSTCCDAWPLPTDQEGSVEGGGGWKMANIGGSDPAQHTTTAKQVVTMANATCASFGHLSSSDHIPKRHSILIPAHVFYEMAIRKKSINIA